MEKSCSSRRGFVAGAVAAASAASLPLRARSAEARTLSLAHVNPPETEYGILSIQFASKLDELTRGALKVQLFPGGQLGQEEELAQKIRSGDVDFAISSTANSASVSPQAGVFSLEYLYPNYAAVLKSVLDPGINATFTELIKATVPGAMSLGLFTQGTRNMVAKFPIRSVADIKGQKMRVQATKTEDTFVAAYGAVPVHIRFGEVYTSLQTGVVAVAENGNDIILANKWYEPAPVVSLTEHEANNAHVFVSQKTWDSFSKDQQTAVRQSFGFARKVESGKVGELDSDALAKFKALQVQVIANVDKRTFAQIARPIIDQQAASLGPYAQTLLKQIRALKA